MEFWGVEVKAGVTLKVSPGEGKLIHISQASIEDSNKVKGENIRMFVKVDEKKLVIGTLSADKFPQIQYDIVFEKDFELSHNGKNGSVFFCGYKAQNPVEDEGYSSDEFDESDSDSDSDDGLPFENDKPTPAIASSAEPTPGAKALEVEGAKAVKVEGTKAEKIKGAKAVKVEDSKADSDGDSSDEDDSDDEDSKGVKVEDAKADSDEDSSDEDDSDDEDSDDSDDDEMDADDSDEDVSSEEEEEEKAPTPKKNDKKRPAETTAQVSAKKDKLVTPLKTDVKKTAASATHKATPHPGKQVGKTSKNESSKTPASAGKSHSNAKRAPK